MKRPKRKYNFLSEINITPLTDVMLVLLIIFMATSTFIVSGQALDLSLPSAEGRDINSPDKIIVLEIKPEGTVYFDGVKMTKNELESKLTAIKKSLGTAPPVLVRADKATRYQNFISVLEILSGNGFDSVSLAVEPESLKK
ncbi:MAG: biopolymer transporter ExbD [Chloroflexi bacterium]|nr:biopolymer transporter ExbD [Chloroflexota bacterium]